MADVNQHCTEETDRVIERLNERTAILHPIPEDDPRIITFEELITRYFEDPHVRNVYPGDNQKPQYMSAIWAQDQEQSTIAKRVSDEVGKSVPVLERKDWYDAEDWHQHFLTDFKDFPEDDDDVEYAAF